MNASPTRPDAARHDQFGLLRSPRFGPYFLTQLLGAFNDNVYKNALIVLVTFQALSLTDGDVSTLVNLAAGLFILPWFLFSGIAGQWSDKYEKSHLVRRIKLLEIAIMALAWVGFYCNSLPLLFGVLFLMGTQSSLFGPVKYGLLSQHLRADELIGGNALVQAGTYLAILLGTIAGGRLQGVLGPANIWVPVAVVAIAVAGYLASRGIPRAEPQAANLKIDWNPLRSSLAIIRQSTTNRTVFISIIGISWFWFVGATYLAQMPNYARSVLGGDESVFTLLLTLFSVGIGLGSLLCERMSARRVDPGLVPLGAIGLTLFGMDLYLAQPEPLAGLRSASEFLLEPGNWRVVLDVVAIGSCGGFFIVPLYALVQSRSEPGMRSRMIASSNIISSLFMVASALLAIGLLGSGMSIPELFLSLAVANAVVAVCLFRTVPEFALGFLTWMLIHALHRLRGRNPQRLPSSGAALLICDHVSRVDALLIAASLPRPVRIVADRRICQGPLAAWICRALEVIDSGAADADRQSSAQAIAGELARGELVCLFAQPAPSADGEVSALDPHLQQILQDNPVPVFGIAVQGRWGSLFSRHPDPWPKRLWHGLRVPLTVQVSTRLGPADTDAASIRRILASLYQA